MPNLDAPYISYHKTLTSELHAVKDRFRNIVRYTERIGDDEETVKEKSHWLSDGEWKESALRTVLRRHLDTPIGRGFVIGAEDSTTQIDILIPKPNKPYVFRDADLFVVTADVVDAIIEVKTSLDKNGIFEAILKLAKVGEFCRECLSHYGLSPQIESPWLGLFVYDEGNRAMPKNVMEAIREAYEQTRVTVNCVSFGRSHFFRFWERGESEEGDLGPDKREALWKSYKLPDIAPSYFIGNVVDVAAHVDNRHSDYAWFSYSRGKREGGTMLDRLWINDVTGEDEGFR